MSTSHASKLAHRVSCLQAPVVHLYFGYNSVLVPGPLVLGNAAMMDCSSCHKYANALLLYYSVQRVFEWCACMMLKASFKDRLCQKDGL